MDILRKIVPKKKRRVQINYLRKGRQCSLDIVYVTENLVTISFPEEASSQASPFGTRDDGPLVEIKKFFDSIAEDRYKLFNCASEVKYDTSVFSGRVVDYGVDEYTAPPFTMIASFVEEVNDWLNDHSDVSNNHIAVVHCGDNKDRSSLMICCYLMATKRAATALHAIQFLNHQRNLLSPSSHQLPAVQTNNLTSPNAHNLHALSPLVPQNNDFVPSQLRFIHYFEIYLQRLEQDNQNYLMMTNHSLSSNALNVNSTQYHQSSLAPSINIHRPKVFKLESIIFSTLPHLNNFRNYKEAMIDRDNDEHTLWFSVARSTTEHKLFFSKNIADEVHACSPSLLSVENNPVELDCCSTLVSGDITIEFYYNSYSNVLFRCQLNTSFLEESIVPTMAKSSSSPRLGIHKSKKSLAGAMSKLKNSSSKGSSGADHTATHVGSPQSNGDTTLVVNILPSLLQQQQTQSTLGTRRSRSISGNIVLKLQRKDLDGPHADTDHKKFPKNFCVELVFKKFEKPQSISLEEVLKNPLFLESYRIFLAKNHAEENLQLWEELQTFKTHKFFSDPLTNVKNLDENSQKMLLAEQSAVVSQCYMIFIKYFDSKSHISVNLPSSIVQPVRKKLRDLFDVIESETNVTKDNKKENPFASWRLSKPGVVMTASDIVSVHLTKLLDRSLLFELKAMFQESEREVLQTMRIDVFQRFLASSIYGDAFQEHQENLQVQQNQLMHEQAKLSKKQRQQRGSAEIPSPVSGSPSLGTHDTNMTSSSSANAKDSGNNNNNNSNDNKNNNAGTNIPSRAIPIVESSGKSSKFSQSCPSPASPLISKLGTSPIHSSSSDPDLSDNTDCIVDDSTIAEADLLDDLLDNSFHFFSTPGTPDSESSVPGTSPITTNSPRTRRQGSTHSPVVVRRIPNHNVPGTPSSPSILTTSASSSGNSSTNNNNNASNLPPHSPQLAVPGTSNTTNQSAGNPNKSPTVMDALRRANSQKFLVNRITSGGLQCSQCMQAIHSDDFGVTLNFLWFHTRCLKCANCQTPLNDSLEDSKNNQGNSASSSVVIRDNKPYCPKCADNENDVTNSTKRSSLRGNHSTEIPVDSTTIANSSTGQNTTGNHSEEKHENLRVSYGNNAAEGVEDSEETSPERKRSESSGFFEQCQSCEKLITNKFSREFEGRFWHIPCFCCSQCKNTPSLNDVTFDVAKQELWCQKCKSLDEFKNLRRQIQSGLDEKKKKTEIGNSSKSSSAEDLIHPTSTNSNNNNTSSSQPALVRNRSKSGGSNSNNNNNTINTPTINNNTSVNHNHNSDNNNKLSSQTMANNSNNNSSGNISTSTLMTSPVLGSKANLCNVCNLPFKKGDAVVSLNKQQQFHSYCVRCSHCNMELSSYAERDGKFYCKADFEKLFHPRCVQCHEIINSQFIRVKDDRTYHLNCFRCQLCQLELVHANLQYMELLDKTFCQDCYNRVIELHQQRQLLKQQKEAVNTSHS